MSERYPLYPDVEVKLVGEDGNAFAVLGACRREMKRHKVPQETVDAFLKEATAGNYDHLLETVVKWFTIR